MSSSFPIEGPGVRGITLTVAIFLAVLSLLVTAGILSVSISAYTLMAIAFIVLRLENLVRGF